jgi:hypothetical protein
MQSDAMSAGVNPGGLQSRIEIRVLICYILVNLGAPVPLEIVKERLHFDGIANYFETAFAISELEESATISFVKEEKGTKFYIATGDTEAVVEALGKNLPASVKERSLSIVRSVVERSRNERDNRVNIEKNENGIYITCSVMEKNLELVSVRLLVPDEETAISVKEHFLEKPIETLINATSALTGAEL